MKISDISNTLVEVINNNGSLNDLVSKLFPEATGEDFDKKKAVISTAISKARRDARSILVKNNVPIEQIETKVQQLFPKFKSKTNVKSDLLALLEKVQ